jgi:hypothetical protein
MRIKFLINADSEAVFVPADRQALLEQGDVVALDWVKDMVHETTVLYNELHNIVFPRSAE